MGEYSSLYRMIYPFAEKCHNTKGIGKGLGFDTLGFNEANPRYILICIDTDEHHHIHLDEEGIFYQGDTTTSSYKGELLVDKKIIEEIKRRMLLNI